MFSNSILAIALASIFIPTSVNSLPAQHNGVLSIPLTQHREQLDFSNHVLHASAKHSSRQAGSGYGSVPEIIDLNYPGGAHWFGLFDVGDSRNLSLVIDTGSYDIVINPGLYKRSSTSLDLGRSGVNHYGIPTSDHRPVLGGSEVAYDIFTDTVSLSGFEARNQILGAVKATTPSHDGFRHQGPHQGIVGFGFPQESPTRLGGKPFVRSLCDENALRECRFGLAYGTDGTGVHIMGGVDRDLFEGDLDVATTDTSWQAVGNIALNNSVVLRDQRMSFDSGAPFVRLPLARSSDHPWRTLYQHTPELTKAQITGPLAQVRTLLDTLGIKSVEATLPDGKTFIEGHYPCGSALMDSPPTFGVQLNDGGPLFNIDPSALKWEVGFQHPDEGICAVPVVGLAHADEWLVGQVWFQGKYLDFNMAKSQLGVATLKPVYSGKE